MKDNTKLVEIKKRLKENVALIKKYNQDMDDASWGYQEGVLITGNEAQFIIEILNQVENENNTRTT